MNIPLDAALFDLEKRLSSEELAELTVSFIDSVSSDSKPKKSFQGVVLQQRNTRRAAILASQETRIYRCRNFWFWGGQGTTASIYLHMGDLGKPSNSDILRNELKNFLAPHRQLPALSKVVSHHAAPVQSTKLLGYHLENFQFSDIRIWWVAAPAACPFPTMCGEITTEINRN